MSFVRYTLYFPPLLGSNGRECPTRTPTLSQLPASDKGARLSKQPNNVRNCCAIAVIARATPQKCGKRELNNTSPGLHVPPGWPPAAPKKFKFSPARPGGQCGDSMREGAMPLAGTCLFFCPEREREERLLHRHLHAILERDTAALPLLKCYSRSAAGKEILASSVRPEAVLCGVVDHLLSAAVLCSPGVDPFDGFVADRLRAVRCDGCVQDLRSLAWGGALVRQVRYHLGMGYFLGGLGPQAEGGGALDAHTNSERTGEALGVARGVLLSLLEEAEGGGGGAAAAAAAEGAAGARLRALALEVHGYALVQALSQPAAVKALLAQAAPLLRAAPGSAREAWGALLPPCMAWLGGRWSQFIRLLEALPCAPAPVLFARCALHRLLPLARANLLQALNDALGVPRQALLPVPALQVALGFRGGGGGGGGGEPAWFQTARFLVQLGMEVREGGDGGARCPLGRLGELLRGAAAAGGREEVVALTAVLSKASPLQCLGQGPAAVPREAALKAQAALAPLREDAFLPLAAAGAPSVGALLDLINQGLC
jgi:hypothetical protein